MVAEVFPECDRDLQPASNEWLLMGLFPTGIGYIREPSGRPQSFNRAIGLDTQPAGQ